MKILFIISGHEMNKKNLECIKTLNNYVQNLRENNNIVDYCGISSKDDFSDFEDIIEFKYKKFLK